jgi:hypothetical protein
MKIGQAFGHPKATRTPCKKIRCPLLVPLQLKIQPSQFAFTPRNLYKQVHDYFYDARIRPVDIIVAIKRHDLTPMFIPSRMEYWVDIG